MVVAIIDRVEDRVPRGENRRGKAQVSCLPQDLHDEGPVARVKRLSIAGNAEVAAACGTELVQDSRVLGCDQAATVFVRASPLRTREAVVTLQVAVIVNLDPEREQFLRRAEILVSTQTEMAFGNRRFRDFSFSCRQAMQSPGQSDVFGRA